MKRRKHLRRSIMPGPRDFCNYQRPNYRNSARLIRFEVYVMLHRRSVMVMYASAGQFATVVENQMSFNDEAE
jgi:hypothetical protein